MAQNNYADAYGYHYPYDVGADLRGYMEDTVPFDDTPVTPHPIGGNEANGTGFHPGTYGTSHQPELHAPALAWYYPPDRISYTQSNEHSFLPTLNTPELMFQLAPANPVIMDKGRQLFSGRPTNLVARSVIVPIYTSLGAGDPPPEARVYPVERYFDASFACVYLAVSMNLPPTPPPIFSSPSVDPAQESDFYWTPNSSNVDPSPQEGLPIMTVGLGAWKCMICGVELRRKQRAVVHFWNKHGDMRVRCSGRCGLIGCDKSYASQDGFEVHLNPVLVQCDSCGKSLLKKNFLRHREGHCHRVNITTRE